MTTVYRARRRHVRNRTDHTDRDCPLLAKASAVDDEEVETIDEDRLCPFCADDEEWNQSDDDDWGYQKALAREAGVDGEIVTDGGLIDACPECESGTIERRTPSKPHSPTTQTNRWYCRQCNASFDEPVKREPKTSNTTLSGLAADLDAADPDAIPDGGHVREPTIYAVEELPADEKGTPCEMWPDKYGHCGLPAEFVMVYEASLDPDDDRRKNCLCCADCVSVESVVTDGGESLDDDLPEPDRSEHERRARQTATSLIAWSRRAGLDPGVVLEDVRAELPRADGGEETDHYCEICERGFETIAALITHDCEERDAPLVTDGGRDLHRMTNVDATEHYRQKAKRLAREKALYVGVLLGGIATFIALFVWEVLQA